MTTELPAGAQIGNYRIERPLGRGGMGVVYVAEHVGLGRKAALKLLAPELAEQANFRERFVRESRSAAAIDHPNIIPLYEAGEFQGQLFIAMRYVEGTDLKQLLRRQGALAAERALAIVAQVGGALDAAHARGLIHRDVKPGNVLLPAGSHHAYLTDFGLTKNVASVTGVTQPGTFVGTIAYMAPEQVEGKPLDGRTDVYSLACVLYECLTGRAPIERDTDVAVLWAKVHEPPPRLSQVRPDLPASLDGALATSMAREKDQRHASCATLVAAAGSTLGRGPTGPVTAPQALTHQPAPVPAAVPAAAPAGAAPPAATRYEATQQDWSEPLGGTAATQPLEPRRGRGGLVIALLLAALLLVGGGTAAALILTRDKGDSGTPTPAADPGPEPGQEPPPEAGGTPAPPPGGELDNQDDRTLVADTVERHWNLIERGRYDEAYDLLAQPQDIPRDQWVAEHQADEPINVTVDAEANTVSGDTAQADVLQLRTEAASGCKDWSGFYRLLKDASGQWLIQKAKISSVPCGE